MAVPRARAAIAGGAAKSHMAPLVKNCPLCHSDGGIRVARVDFATIWNRLHLERGVAYPDEVRAELGPAAATELVSCRTCGLQYFTPSKPGDSRFYATLTRTGYYEPDRWEFGVVANQIDNTMSLLDVGCGRGDFLAAVSDRTRRAVGVDENPEAIQELRSRGIEGYATNLIRFAEKEAEQFDVVSAFQTLEHLATVDELIQPALRCLAPGGRLFISVPNRNRTWRPAFEPLDHPPHHISRWSRHQFEVLGARYQLQLETVWFENADLSVLIELATADVQSALAPFTPSRILRFLTRTYRRLLWSVPRLRPAIRRSVRAENAVGHTMLAQFRK